eukprot:g29462.t1
MDLHVAEAERQFSKTMSYLPLDHYSTMALQATISNTVHDLIASSDLASSLIDPQASTVPFYLLPNTFPYNSKRCNTCPYTTSLTFIQDLKQSFQVRQSFSCINSNLVYCIRAPNVVFSTLVRPNVAE